MFEKKEVTRHRYGVRGFSEYNQGSNGAANAQFFKNYVKSVKEKDESILESHTLLENKRDEILNRANNGHIINGRHEKVMENFYKKGKEIVYKEIMFRLFEQCLLIDEDVKKENQDSIKELIENYVNNNHDYESFSKMSEKSRFLCDIKKVCESTARKVAIRKSEEEKKSDNVNLNIEFELNDKESKELEKDIASLDSDTLEKLVKDKVVQVLEDEKKRAVKKEELEEEIKNKTEEGAAESVRRIIHNKNVVEETTLFDALMRESYKDVLESVVNTQYVNKNKLSEIGLDQDEIDFKIEDHEKDPDNADSWDSDNEIDNIDLIDTEIEFGPKDSNEDSVMTDNDEEHVKQSDVDNTLKNKQSDNVNLVARMENNNKFMMDAVLAEALAKYTLLEMCYTMKLDDYRPDHLRKLITSLIQS